jgi:hypothetical protein
MNNLFLRSDMNTSKSVQPTRKLQMARAWFIETSSWLPCLIATVACLLLAATAAHQ